MNGDGARYASKAEALAIDRAMLEKNLRTLTRLGETCGEWSDKVDARQTGYSLHVKFDKKVDVFLAAEHAEVMQMCPAMLADAIRRLLAIVDEEAARVTPVVAPVERRPQTRETG